MRELLSNNSLFVGQLCEDTRGVQYVMKTQVITPSTNTLGFYAIRQTKDQSVAVIMVRKTLFYLSKFNKLQTF